MGFFKKKVEETDIQKEIAYLRKELVDNISMRSELERNLEYTKAELKDAEALLEANKVYKHTSEEYRVRNERLEYKLKCREDELNRTKEELEAKDDKYNKLFIKANKTRDERKLVEEELTKLQQEFVDKLDARLEEMLSENIKTDFEVVEGNMEIFLDEHKGAVSKQAYKDKLKEVLDDISESY